MLSILLLVACVYVAYRLSPREREEDAHIHGAGQIGLAAAVALFGVDYFTSYFYATGEMMGALHPYGLERYGYVAVAAIAVANFVFGALYMYSLGIFNEGGGSYTASMRYLAPSLSLIVAVVLIQDTSSPSSSHRSPAWTSFFRSSEPTEPTGRSDSSSAHSW
jgi:hypothetical protein